MTMKKYIAKTLALLFLIAIGPIALAGCHTAHGFGKDVENAGEKIQNGTE